MPMDRRGTRPTGDGARESAPEARHAGRRADLRSWPVRQRARDRFVVLADGAGDMERLSEDDARSLSAQGRVVFFYCDDTPMMTRIVEFQHGIETWALTHDGSEGGHEMIVAGTPPPRAREILAEATAAQAAEDPDAEYPVDHIYDVTAAFGREHIGFRHDVTLTDDALPPTWELQETSGATRGGPTDPARASGQEASGFIRQLLHRLRGRN
jgi:hypothetical protein